MKKIILYFNNITIDKYKHFFIGFFIYGLFSIISPIVGLLTVCIVAAAKEIIYDKLMKKGTPELLDFIYTVVPTIMFYLITLLR